MNERLMFALPYNHSEASLCKASKAAQWEQKVADTSQNVKDLEGPGVLDFFFSECTIH